ncbi:MAG: hypothetical protein ACE3JP_08910 [Ectobacillus sp.]
MRRLYSDIFTLSDNGQSMNRKKRKVLYSIRFLRNLKKTLPS